MPLVRSLVFKRYTYIANTIVSLSEIMPIYSHYVIKGLIYITITALFSRKPLSCSNYIKLNIHLTCDI